MVKIISACNIFSQNFFAQEVKDMNLDVLRGMLSLYNSSVHILRYEDDVEGRPNVNAYFITITFLFNNAPYKSPEITDRMIFTLTLMVEKDFIVKTHQNLIDASNNENGKAKVELWLSEPKPRWFSVSKNALTLNDDCLVIH